MGCACNFFTTSPDCYNVRSVWNPFNFDNKLTIEGDWQAMPFILNKKTDTRWHTCHRELRWTDFDQYQHVNNAKYLEFAQDARMVFLKDVLLEMDIAVPPFFVRHTTIDYPRPLSPGESEVAVSSFFTSLGTRSCVMRQQIKDSLGRVASTIDTVMVGIDVMTGKSREWSEQDLKNMGLFLIPVSDDEESNSSETSARERNRTRPVEKANNAS
ncbi:Long-chain acyl-CoA thioesterase FadM [Corynebacterium auriscanis]|nr:Long-chain acyl-CoA thioesterase FadM [Corynebacterium auriscanis]